MHYWKALFTTIFLTIACCNSSKAQPFFSLPDCIVLNKIDSLFSAKDYVSTLNEINAIQAKGLQLMSDRQVHLRQFYCYKNLQILDTAFYHLQQALMMGLHCRELPCDIADDFLVFDSTRNKSIAALFSKNNSIISIDYQLLNQINDMISYDQIVRDNVKYIDSNLYLNIDSIRRTLSIGVVDSINLQKLRLIIAKYGWPGCNILGIKGDIDFWGLVQHADKDVELQKTALILLEAQLRINNSRKENYAYLYDRICVNDNKPQLFGTQVKNADKNNFELHPLQDAANVDVYRKAFNLTSLEVYIAYFKQHK